ncbi:MAG: PAS domain-containing protein [Byssovorax sp.]
MQTDSEQDKAGSLMIDAGEQKNKRILVIDDSEDIHKDFRRVLGRRADTAELDDIEASLFGASSSSGGQPVFEVTSAHQGEQGLAAVRRALADGAPYAMAFVDLRMPPGWDGLETLSRIWEEDPALQAVICSAYSDYSWADITARLGQTHRLLILKKPADPIEVRQMACALTEKWNFERALVRSEADNRLLLEVLPDALLRVDKDGVCLHFKPSSELQLAGASGPFSPGCHLRDVLPEVVAGQIMDSVARTLSGDTDQLFEYQGLAGEAGRTHEARIVRNGSGEALVILRDVTERKRTETEAAERRALEETVRAQANALLELSMPIIPISDEIVVVPLIGDLNAERMRHLQETLVQGIAKSRAHVVLLDLTGVPSLDAESADAIVRAAQAARLLGAKVILTGIRSDVASLLVSQGRDLSGISTHGTLESGIASAMGRR